MRASLPALALLAALPGALACSRAARPERTPPRGDLVVRRGELRACQLLTGELVAEKAESMIVPQAPGWQVQIRWLARDGSLVAAGEPVAIFDSGSSGSDLEDKKLKAAESARELERLAAEGESKAAEKRYAVEEKRTALEKARARAKVPAELLPLAEVQERARAAERAEADLEKAERALATGLAASRADVLIKRIELDRSRREIAAAEAGRAALTLTAPRSGLVLVGRHPWEDRELREGDSVWVGMTVASLPDLSSLGVLARLSDVDDGRIASGMAASCVLDAYPDRLLPCRIGDISAVAGEAARGARLRRAFAVHVALSGADPERMRPGMSVRVEVCAAPRKGLLAPRAGLDLSVSPPRARLAAGSETPVRLGPCDPLDCLVASGLDAGARLRPLSADRAEAPG